MKLKSQTLHSKHAVISAIDKK